MHFLTIAAMTFVLAGSSACQACSSTPSPVSLLPGDSGPCTTINETLLPDGGYETTLVPCHFAKGK